MPTIINTISCTDELKDYCFRRLGAPCLNIEVDVDQANDRIDDAIQLFCQRHFDGVEEIWDKYTLSSSDISRGYKTIKDDVISIIELIPMTGANIEGAEPWADLQYQFRLHNMIDFTSPSMSYYRLSMQHINLVNQLLTPTRTFTFNKATHNISLRGNVSEGNFFIIHGYRAVDPEMYTDVYNDEYLKRLATAMIKEQWGTNLKKMDGIQLPGGVTINGKQIYDEAIEELKELREELKSTFELPVDMMIG